MNDVINGNVGIGVSCDSVSFVVLDFIQVASDCQVLQITVYFLIVDLIDTRFHLSNYILSIFKNVLGGSCYGRQFRLNHSIIS